MKTIALILTIILFVPQLSAQQQNIVNKAYFFSGDTIHFASKSIIASSFDLRIDNKKVMPSEYYLNPIVSKLFIYNQTPDSILISYEYLQLDLSKPFFNKSDTLIFIEKNEDLIQNYLFSLDDEVSSIDLFGNNHLEKQGSISRGVTVGNNQNLSFQSTLNLQLNGKIGPDLYIKGSISDDNIPFQPEGNTQKLQEFDQVLLQLYNDVFSVTAGDFWLKKPAGYFLNYTKRTQGLSLDYISKPFADINSKLNHKISAAFSKGKFSRNIIQGVEGNQGPYKLLGNENEQNIIILAGTEKVYIDGNLLTRGQAYDYTINYNSSEISFTANQFITKDKRIIVEFQYSDLNYARSLFVYNGEIKGEKHNLWLNYYSEQDAKNQPIQQKLNFNQKSFLASIGDSISLAYLPSIYESEFDENRIMYELIDTIGYDSVLLFSNEKNYAKYQSNFRFVGQGNGNYIIEKYTANGKVYKWIKPENGLLQGDYSPLQLITPPQKNKMITFGGDYQLTRNIKSKIEFAMSDFDLNSFSTLHNNNDKGYALKWNINQNKQFKSKGTAFKSFASFEINDRNFKPIQWFRSAEFDRDWNLRYKNYNGNQYISTAGLNFSKENLGRINLNLNQFTWGKDYSGLKTDLLFKIKKNNYLLSYNANYLISEGEESSNFYRHKTNLAKNWKYFSIGVLDIFESNSILFDKQLSLSSYQFYDIKSYISIGDSTKNWHELYVQKRFDWHPDSSTLGLSANANNIGLTSYFLSNKSNQLKLNINYRQLEILQPNLINQASENTILSRLEHNLRLFNGVITSRTFYEINSGLELKRDFVYIIVNSGQGVYDWIDYNNDGIKDIGEFEIAKFQDQAEYIRVSIVSNNYIRTYGNQFTQILFLKPERIYKNTIGIKKALGLLSNQTIMKVNKKNNYNDGFNSINPFAISIADSNLIHTVSNFRNTLFFNRLNSKFGLEYQIQSLNSKYILTNGADSKSQFSQEVVLRLNLAKYYNLNLSYKSGNLISLTEYALARNYNINYSTINTILSFQPNTIYRIALENEYTTKLNESDFSELAIINNLGINIRLNQPKKGSLLTSFNYILIGYNSLTNTPIAFEMLNALETGTNFTWHTTYQRKVAENLQVNFNYSGRKSENSKFIHSGGMELRAFF